MISSVMSSWALATWDHFAWPFSILLWTLESRTGQRDGVKARTLSTKTKSQTANTFSFAWKLEQRKLEDYWCAPLAAPPLSIIVLYSIAQHNRNDMICFAWSSGLLPRLRSKHGWPEIKAILKPYLPKARCNQHFAKSGPPIPRYSPYALPPLPLIWVSTCINGINGGSPGEKSSATLQEVLIHSPTFDSVLATFPPSSPQAFLFFAIVRSNESMSTAPKNKLKDMSWMVLIDGI